MSLADLWQAVVRYRLTIFAAVLACVLAGAAYVFVKTPVYRASVTVRVGQVAGTGPFETADVVASRLFAEFGEDVAEGVKRTPPFLRRATPSKAIPGAVDLIAEGGTPQDSVLLLERVVERLQKVHGDLYSRNVKYLDERLRNVDEQLILLRQQHKEIVSLLERIKKDNPLQASLLAVEGSRVATSIAELEANRPEFALKISSPQTYLTETIGGIEAPARPSAPRKALVLVLSAAIGLVLGVMLALATFVGLFGPARSKINRG